MKKRIFYLMLVLIILSGCGSPSVPAGPAEDTAPVKIDWRELGEGPLGWVIEVRIQNQTADQFERDAVVTITDDDGTVLGEGTIHARIAPHDYNSYPIHCKVGSSYNVDVEWVDEAPQTAAPEPSTGGTVSGGEDDRGIPGMDPSALLSVLTGDPFYIPAVTPSVVADEYREFVCVSISDTADSGVMYDYSVSLDADEEIVGASFGVAATTASETQLLLAADLYFYAVSLLSYDTADTDTLSTWFADNLESAGDTAITTTVGDAVFELYGIPGVMYWVDISKAAQ